MIALISLTFIFGLSECTGVSGGCFFTTSFFNLSSLAIEVASICFSALVFATLFLLPPIFSSIGSSDGAGAIATNPFGGFENFNFNDIGLFSSIEALDSEFFLFLVRRLSSAGGSG